MVQKRCFYEWSCRVPLILRFPDGWRAGSAVQTPVSLLDLLPTFAEIAGNGDLLPHDGDSLLPVIEGEGGGRCVFAQAHEAVGMPCIMMREGRYKYNYIHGYDPQLFDLQADPGEWNNLAADPGHAGVARRMEGAILGRFDPAAMEQENLESLYRRRLIRDVMRERGQTWWHFPRYDYRQGAMDQYLGGETP